MHYSVEWLTPSQAQASLALKETLRVPRTVNLVGPAGVGKTFLTWVLAEELGYTYFPHLESFSLAQDVAASGVIIDNTDPSRYTHRSVLKALQFQDVKRAVLVTRELVRDYTHYVELSLSPEDVETVCHNLVSVGGFFSDPHPTNLWYLINPSLRRA
jgi:MoxR-like ATPase